MTITAIRDPRIAQGFSALSNAFFPDPMNVAKAQALAAQRDMMMARTGVYDAQSSAMWDSTDAARTQAGIISDPAWTNNPSSVARLFAAEAMRGANRDPRFITAARLGINPQALNQQDLSTVLAAGGQNYQTTPQGVQDQLINQQVLGNIQNEGRISAAEARADAAIAAAEARAQALIERQRLANQGLVDRQGLINQGNAAEAGIRADASRDVANTRAGALVERQNLANAGNVTEAQTRADATRDAATIRAGGQVGAAQARGPAGAGRAGSVPTISTAELQRLQQQVVGRIGSVLRDQYGYNIKPGDIQLDADFQNRVFADATNEYQRTKNADAAVQFALRNNPVGRDNIERLDSRLNPLSAVSVRVGKGSAPAAPESWRTVRQNPAAAQGAAAGQIIGEMGRGGAPAPAPTGPGASVGLTDFGQLPDNTIIRHKATGQLMRIQNGQPVPIQGAGQ